jgi:hypothetical protein
MRVPASVVLVLVAFSLPARAFEGFEGTRALGMGSATRAWALGDSGTLLNPSGMVLAKSYNVEAGYAYARLLSDQYLHASVVDSTSASQLAGGLYYTYHAGRPAPGVTGHGHEVGASAALPFGDNVSLGLTVKWFKLEGADKGPNLVDGGVSFDAGVTVRPIESLSLAVVGSNLRDLSTGQAPQQLGYGVAFLPTAGLVLAADGVTTFTRDDRSGRRGTGFRGGAEWLILERFGLRAGGGYDPTAGVGYLSAGASAVSEIGAVDVGFRGDLSPEQQTLGPHNGDRNFILGVSLRLFVPAPPSSP